MQVEAAPRQQMVLKQSAAQARHDGLQQVLDRLNALNEDATALKAGKDAAYNIDGTDYTSHTNTISSASGATGFVFGVELNLTGAGSFTVSVSPPSVDKNAVISAAKSFVDAYNSAVDLMQSKVNEKRVPNGPSP